MNVIVITFSLADVRLTVRQQTVKVNYHTNRR